MLYGRQQTTDNIVVCMSDNLGHLQLVKIRDYNEIAVFITAVFVTFSHSALTVICKGRRESLILCLKRPRPISRYSPITLSEML